MHFFFFLRAHAPSYIRDSPNASSSSSSSKLPHRGEYNLATAAHSGPLGRAPQTCYYYFSLYVFFFFLLKLLHSHTPPISSFFVLPSPFLFFKCTHTRLSLSDALARPPACCTIHDIYFQRVLRPDLAQRELYIEIKNNFRRIYMTHTHASYTHIS